MAWTSLTFDFGSLLTSTKMTQMFDNFAALANGDTGAPSVQTAGLADGAVTQIKIGALAVAIDKLKTSIGSISALDGNYTLPGGEYGFYPQIMAESNSLAECSAFIGNYFNNTSYATNIYLKGDTSGSTVYAQQRYVVASGEVHWIFVWFKNGNVKGMWQAPDHSCFGNRGVTHPFPDYNPATDEIVVINPSLEIVEEINALMLPAEGGGWLTKEKIAQGIEIDYMAPTRDFLEVFNELYEIDGGKQADWPDIPITVALPRTHKGKVVSDWRMMPTGIILTPIKKVLSRPEYITPVKIKKKQKI
jgi:hypothetical protein